MKCTYISSNTIHSFKYLKVKKNGQLNIAADMSNSVMTCQELLAFSFAFSAILLTGQTTLDCLCLSIKRQPDFEARKFSNHAGNGFFNKHFQKEKRPHRSFAFNVCRLYECIISHIKRFFSKLRNCVRRLVANKFFQQGILLAILINTLSMGIGELNQ